MKNAIYLVLIVIIFLILAFIYMNSVKESYKESYEMLDQKRVSYLYQEPFIGYCIENLECPVKINDVIYIDSTDKDFKRYLNRHFKDFLSKETEYIKYVPVYDTKNFKRRGFVLLSTGIDGGLSNKISIDDSVYFDNINNYIKAYNFSNHPQVMDTIREVNEIRFNIWNFLFGDKDYIIFHFDLMHYFENQYEQSFSLDDLVDRILNRNYINGRVINQVYAFEGTIDSIGSRYIYMSHNEYRVKSYKFYQDEEYIDNGESVTLTGVLSNIDKKNKEIVFENAVKLDKKKNL